MWAHERLAKRGSWEGMGFDKIRFPDDIFTDFINHGFGKKNNTFYVL